jgi:tyrosyl-tRNA synthetase
MSAMLPVDEQMRLLTRGVEYGDEQIRTTMEQELRERLSEGRPLRVYLGVDPSAPDLTLGHTVPMYKLRQFQDLGHETVFLIGNFTGLVGDPSDKDARRPILTPDELEANARTYTEQAFKVLDPERTIIDYNANWLGKLTFADLIQIASNFTVGQFLQRENFALRRERGDPIYLHEFFYALMQGYDAVALRCDVQVGGTDQLFNIMAGRTLQRAYGQRPQVPVCVPILVGTDGHLRMSKTQGNHIALTDPPDEMYGKVMSLPDGLIVDYFTLVTRVPAGEVEEIGRQLQERSVNPMDLKKRLAHEIVSQYHGPEAADRAEEQFTHVIQLRATVSGTSTVRAELTIGREVAISSLESYGNDLMALLLHEGLVRSKGEARRLLKQGAIDVNGQPISDFSLPFRPGMVIRVGKHRFLRIVDTDQE